MKTVTFGMYWQEYGWQTIALPDDIDETDMNAVKCYIESNWNDIPLPQGSYVQCSDELDTEYIEVHTDKEGE